MKQPIIFKVLESEECAGILAPYILSSEINDLVESLYSKNKDLIDMINSLPDEILRGSVPRAYKRLPYESMVESHYTGNSNSYGNPVISGAQVSTDANNVNTSILPPHKIYYTNPNNLTDPRYESNIYNPCLRDATNRGIFQTGNYPEEVKDYSSNTNNTINITSGHCQYVDEKERYMINKMVSSMINSSMNSIVDLQIQNILTALIQADMIPVKYPIINGLRVILETIAQVLDEMPKAAIDILRFGLYTDTNRSILSPHKVSVIRPFICTKGNEYSEYIKDILLSVLRSYPNTVEVSVLSDDQFITVHSNCPVDLDFECSIDIDPMSSVSRFTMLFTDINKFKPDVILSVHVPPCVQPLFPGNHMAIPYGSSGKLSFMINHYDEYDIDGIVLNRRFYRIDDLYNERINSFRGLGIVSIKATLKEFDNYSALLELNYVGMMKDLNIDLMAIRVLDNTECEIEDMEVGYELSETQVLNVSFDNRTIASSNGVCPCMAENVDDENDNVAEDDTSETENLPNESDETEKQYHLTVNVPFNNSITSIRRPDDIIVHKIIRTFDDNGICDSFEYEDVTDGFSKTLVGVNKDTLVMANRIDLATKITDKSEYIVKFGRGSLYTTLKVLTESLPATNSEDVLHFAIDPFGCTFALLEDTVEDYPKWLNPVKPEDGDSEEPTDSEEVTPDNPDDNGDKIPTNPDSSNPEDSEGDIENTPDEPTGDIENNDGDSTENGDYGTIDTSEKEPIEPGSSNTDDDGEVENTENTESETDNNEESLEDTIE